MWSVSVYMHVEYVFTACVRSMCACMWSECACVWSVHACGVCMRHCEAAAETGQSPRGSLPSVSLSATGTTARLSTDHSHFHQFRDA